MISIQKSAYFSILLIASIVILVYSKALLLPFILGFIFWFLIRESKQGLINVSYICRQIPESILTLVASLLIFIVFGLVIKMISSNIQTLSIQLPLYEENLNHTIDSIDESLEINSTEYLKHYFKEFDFTQAIKAVLNSISDLFSNALLILFYTIFLLLEEQVFDSKLRAIYSSNNSGYIRTKAILTKIESSVSNYLTVKTLLSLLTGVLSYFALLLIGIDAPVFWAFLIFLLNFIPTVGSLIATLFPAVFALFQFGEFQYLFLVLGLVGAVQMIIGNIVEPRVMGSSLNISSLIVIISLSFWGSIWGITGMILSVPITVISIILFAQFEQTRAIAIFLSDKGNIKQLLLDE
ncbi:AI-2E family transporter [Cyclobacteriaceae bacterium]|nr:AI-2E family transporter [Cyclobacteriaceae bacterium]